ncbi:MAG TPA: cupredoxin domain-containing protein [Methylophilaceae bacterium]|jgi:plastocyanin domain-containing protein|nr:cupredoxin domain-containing protein [Methylophilaceae bacterium]
MSELFVTLGGLAAIGLIAWWFWLSSPKAEHSSAQQPIDIQVKDGVYQPAALDVPAGQALTLRFTRHDATPCAEKVVFGDLGISAELPLGKARSVTLPPLKPGQYEFTCQMGMYRGRLVATQT